VQLGIIGLPNVGKSTLFNALTKGHTTVARYPFTTVEPNIGVVEVPDGRLTELQRLIDAQEVTPTTIKFLDLAGLVKGASKGEGLGNQFLAQIRGVDGVAHVVRCFEDSQVAHVALTIGPLRDIEIVNIELALADLEIVERRIAKAKRIQKGGDRQASREIELLDRIKDVLAKGESIHSRDFGKKELERMYQYQLLRVKPILYVANIAEEAVGIPADSYLQEVQECGAKEGSPVVPLCVKLEAEISELPPKDAGEFRMELGLPETGLTRLIRAGYELLNLVTFFTIEHGKLQAWTLESGSSVIQAAGKVHSDMARGFIRAEVVGYSDLVRAGSVAKAREEGLIKLEGKDYTIGDGDIVTFRFRV
jgi:hypothetical protein